jgi:hypothetical protein
MINRLLKYSDGFYKPALVIFFIKCSFGNGVLPEVECINLMVSVVSDDSYVQPFRTICW